MNKPILVFLTAIILALGALCLAQSRKLARQGTELATLRVQAEDQSRQLATLESARKHSDQQRRQLLRESDQIAAELQTRLAAATNALEAAASNPPAADEAAEGDKDSGGFGKALAKMMSDPDTKQFIRNQQRLMMDSMYGPLLKQMALNPDEAAKFKELLLDNMMRGAEKAGSLFGGGAATNRQEMVKAMTDEQKSFEDQVKAFLGEARYSQYKDYQQTVGERVQLNMFKQQFTSGDAPLTDQQTEQLLTLMKEEKQTAASTLGQAFPNSGQDAAALEALASEEKVGKLLQAQETVNQRVFERARNVLTPEQLDSFGQFQTNQLQMMRMGMNMAKKMFGSGKPANESPLPKP